MNIGSKDTKINKSMQNWHIYRAIVSYETEVVSISRRVICTIMNLKQCKGNKKHR